MKTFFWLLVPIILFSQLPAEARMREFYKIELIWPGHPTIICAYAEGYRPFQPPDNYAYDGQCNTGTNGHGVSPIIRNQALYDFLKNAVWTHTNTYGECYNDGHSCSDYQYKVDDSNLPVHLQSAEYRVAMLTAAVTDPAEIANAAAARASMDPQVVADQAALDAQTATATHTRLTQAATEAQEQLTREPLNIWARSVRDAMTRAAQEAQLTVNQANANAQRTRELAMESVMRAMREAQEQELAAHRAVIRALCNRLGVPVPDGF